VDYAYAAFRPLGGTHRLSLSWRFGSVAEAHYERGMGYLRRGDDARAVIEFARTVALDPSHKRALLRLREANERIQAEQKSLRMP
jgi:Tfp pilus assembly protein PilF